MQFFWPVFWTIVLLLILFGIIWGSVSSRLNSKKPLSFGGLLLPKIDGAFSADRRYFITINSGAKFESVRILGFAEAVAGPESQV